MAFLVNVAKFLTLNWASGCFAN